MAVGCPWSCIIIDANWSYGWYWCRCWCCSIVVVGQSVGQSVWEPLPSTALEDLDWGTRLPFF